jgi:hypothetical protein
LYSWLTRRSELLSLLGFNPYACVQRELAYCATPFPDSSARAATLYSANTFCPAPAA